MTEQQYQQPPPPQQQPYQQYYQPKPAITDNFVGKGRLGLFLLLGALFIFIGILILDLCFAGVLEGDIRSIVFLGNLVFDLGIIAMFTLLFLGGITRDDLAETSRNHMIRAGGFVLGLYVATWALRIVYGSMLGASSYYW